MTAQHAAISNAIDLLLGVINPNDMSITYNSKLVEISAFSPVGAFVFNQEQIEITKGLNIINLKTKINVPEGVAIALILEAPFNSCLLVSSNLLLIDPSSECIHLEFRVHNLGNDFVIKPKSSLLRLIAIKTFVTECTKTDEMR